MANFIFDAAKRKLLDRNLSGTMNLETNGSGVSGSDAFRVILMTTLKLSAATHGALTNMQTLVDATSVTEMAQAVSGYDIEGKVLANAEWDASSTTGESSFTFLKADDISWTGLGAVTDDPIVGAVLYIDTSNDNVAASDFSSTDFPVAYFDFDAQPDGGTLTLQWGSSTGAATSGAQGVVLKIG